MLVFRFALSILVSFLISFLLVPQLCLLADRLNFYDKPDGKLKRQPKKVPYLGGVAIYFGFLFSVLLIFPCIHNLYLYLFAATLLLLVGLVDDFLSLSPQQKFSGQILASVLFIYAGFFLKDPFFNSLISIAISFIWFLSVINALNLVDVMDGLSATLSMCISASFCLFFYLAGNFDSMLLFGSLFGATLGFFVYNVPPAKIYMGDAGTLFIGGLLASAPFFMTWNKFNTFGFLTPGIIFLLQILEIVGLILIRSYKSIPFYNGSPDHFSIYLQNKGWSKLKILKFCFMLNLILLIIATTFFIEQLNLAYLVVLIMLFCVFWIKIII